MKSDFDHWNLSMLITSINIKISMTHVYIELKMIEQQWLQLRKKFVLGYCIKVVI